MLSFLFALVPVVSIAAYVPQLWRLAQNPSSARALSLVTWLTWSATGVVSLLYGAFVVADALLTAVFAANAAGQLAVTGFAVWSRLVPAPADPEPNPPAATH